MIPVESPYVSRVPSVTKSDWRGGCRQSHCRSERHSARDERAL